jgi:uncharacterized alkaline shock family protein YloU
VAKQKRRLVKVELILSVKPGVTAAEARREARCRINHEVGYYSNLDTPDVHVRSMKGIR